MPSISDPIISIKGLGKKTSDRLNQLGIHTLEHSNCLCLEGMTSILSIVASIKISSLRLASDREVIEVLS